MILKKNSQRNNKELYVVLYVGEGCKAGNNCVGNQTGGGCVGHNCHDIYIY